MAGLHVTLAFIDPGIDYVAVALFRAESTGRLIHAGPIEKLPRLIGVRCIKTSPRDPLAERLGTIGRVLRDTLIQHRADYVGIELPRTANTYVERKERRGGEAEGGKVRTDQSKLYMAIGAITAGASLAQAKVVTVPASTTPKEQRLEDLDKYFKALRAPNQWPNGDDRDAIHIGIHAEWPY